MSSVMKVGQFALPVANHDFIAKNLTLYTLLPCVQISTLVMTTRVQRSPVCQTNILPSLTSWMDGSQVLQNLFDLV